jgi:Carboxypeptidase regulatory-like domain
MKRVLVGMAVLAVVLVGAHNLGAQHKGAGVISGVVLGPDDKPVSHASVTYQSSAGVAPHAVHADSQGRFTIAKLRSDNYDLRASGRGVFSEWEKNVSVRSGQTKSITLRLIYAKEVPKTYTKSKAKE